MNRFLEILSPDKGTPLVGVVSIGVDGFATIHNSWLKELILKAGYTYEESDR